MTVIRAAAVCDAVGTHHRPGAVAVKNGRVAAAGPFEDLPRRLTEDARIVDRPNLLLLPALVNAHAHLDLTSVGPRPFGGDFVAWLRQLIAGRPRDPKQIEASVTRGLALSRDSGVGHIGDVAGSVEAIEAWRAATTKHPIAGVGFLECFGFGDRPRTATGQPLDEALDTLVFESPVPGHHRGVVIGAAPHAPYSTGAEAYEHATKLSQRGIYRLTTHLAESPAEIEFVRDATGPLIELLATLGKQPATLETTGLHPVEWLEPHLRRARWLLAHCNYVEESHIEILQRTGASVAYCPIASDYFGHGPHRYRDMLEAGVNVCLGTDSIVCQPAGVAQPLSVFEQMRHLYRRDSTDPLTLLRMATVNGMLALEFSETDATLQKRAPANFAAIVIDPDDPTDALVQALRNDAPVQSIKTGALAKVQRGETSDV